MPSKTIITFLAQAAHHAPSADNLQPWRFDWDGQTLSVSYDSDRVGNSTFRADSPATLLAFGAVLENLSQAAEALKIDLKPQISSEFGVNTPVVFKTSIERKDKLTVPADSLPLFKRHTNRLSYLPKPLPSNLTSLLKKRTLEKARVVILENKSEINMIAYLVRKASEVRFQIQEIHEWLGKSLRFGAEAGKARNGLDVLTLDLPLGGTLLLRLIKDWRRMAFLNRFGLYKLMAAIDAAPVRKAPALLGIISPSKTNDLIDAGRLMNRIWIHLNSENIAVHPYYVVADQIHRLQEACVPDRLTSQVTILEEKSRRIFHLQENERLQMLFRAGYPKSQPNLSKRLPLETVFADRSSQTNDG